VAKNRGHELHECTRRVITFLIIFVRPKDAGAREGKQMLLFVKFRVIRGKKTEATKATNGFYFLYNFLKAKSGRGKRGKPDTGLS